MAVSMKFQWKMIKYPLSRLEIASTGSRLSLSFGLHTSDTAVRKSLNFADRLLFRYFDRLCP